MDVLTMTIDWKPLSQLFTTLGGTFALPNLEDAIANALRSGELPVRARRYARPAFTRIEKLLDHRSHIEVRTNRIELHDDKAKSVVDAIMAARGMGSSCFVNAEADGKSVEVWLLENASPQSFLSEYAPPWLYIEEKPTRSQPKRNQVKKLLRQMFPNGLRSEDEMPFSTILGQCRGANWPNNLSKDTIRRAVNELRDETTPIE